MAIIIRPISQDEFAMVGNIMDEMHSPSMNTVCDHVRYVYDTARRYVADPEVRAVIMGECKGIMVYAKRMDNRLKYLQKVKEYGI